MQSCNRIKRNPVIAKTGVSRTQQQFKSAVNVNNIIARYSSTGVLPQDRREAFYGDFSVVPDFQERRQVIINAENAFMALPSKLRKRFNNNAGELMEFLQDEKNLDEAIALGLVDAKKTESGNMPDQETVSKSETEGEKTVSKGETEGEKSVSKKGGKSASAQ